MDLKEKILKIKLINRVILLDSTPSTNDYAKNLLSEGKTESSVIISREQTAGKGRLDRFWFSPLGKGLWMTVTVPFDFQEINVTQMQFLVSLAVCRAINIFTNDPPEIKWPNDILISQKKVCGLLSESFTSSITNKITHCIFGIGINIKAAFKDFPEIIRDTAGSLEMFSMKKISIEDVCCEILTEFERQINNIWKKRFTDIFLEWKSLCGTIGKKIEFERKGKMFSGIAVDVHDDGSLVVETAYKKRYNLYAGDINYMVCRV